MNRAAILAAVFAAAGIGFAVPALADGDDNDPHMKLFLWDGGYYLEPRPERMTTPKQNQGTTTNRTGRGGPMMNRGVDGKGKMPKDGR